MNALPERTEKLLVFPPPPRVTFRRKGIPIPLRLVGYFLIPHVWVGIWLAWGVLLAAAMTLFGHDVAATIVSSEKTTGKNPRVRLVYTFADNGRAITQSDSVSGHRFDGVRAGAVMTVRMLHIGSMRKIRFAGENSEPGILFALFWWGVLAIFFYVMILATLAQRRLAQIGEATRGTITGKRVQRGKSTTYTLSYTFRPPVGGQLSRQMNVNRSDYDTASVNDKVIVLYDPANPKRSHLYKYSQYAARDRYGEEVPADGG